jgi:hypothetical protein
MAYQLAIDTPGGLPHPSFEYQSLELALEAAEHGISEGYLEIAGGLTVCTGPGTVYKVISDDHIREGMPQEDKPYYMVVTVAGGQLPPFGFDSEAEATAALKAALEDGAGYHGVIRHVAKTGHEYNFVVLSAGAVIMRMDRARLLDNQKRLLEEKMRQRQAEGEGGLSVPPTILIPGKN